MDAPAFENLDLACARTGQAIAEKPSKELEKLVTSALAVLEERREIGRASCRERV